MTVGSASSANNRFLSTTRLTLGKDLTSARTVGNASILRLNFFSTRESTQDDKIMSVMNVGRLSAPKTSFLSTRESTVEKSLVSVVNVGSAQAPHRPHSTPESSQWREALQMHCLWQVLHLQEQTSSSRESTLEKSPMNAVSVGRPSTNGIPLPGTRKFIQEKGLSHSWEALSPWSQLKDRYFKGCRQELNLVSQSQGLTMRAKHLRNFLQLTCTLQSA